MLWVIAAPGRKSRRLPDSQRPSVHRLMSVRDKSCARPVAAGMSPAENELTTFSPLPFLIPSLCRTSGRGIFLCADLLC